MKRIEAVFILIMISSLIGCSSTSSHQELQQASAPSSSKKTIGILWWPTDPQAGIYQFADDIDGCLTDIITERCPEFNLIHRQAIRNCLFPLLEPGTQPTSEAAFAALLRRDDVQQRLATKGLHYLVTVTGGTSKDADGFIFCGAGYGGAGCLGFAWIDKDTRIDAVIWELPGQARSEHLEGSATGKTLIPAFILPIPLPAPTVSKACDGLGQRIVDYIRIHSGGAECGAAP